jgi:hypothetical protein
MATRSRARTTRSIVGAATLLLLFVTTIWRGSPIGASLRARATALRATTIVLIFERRIARERDRDRTARVLCARGEHDAVDDLRGADPRLVTDDADAG